MFGDQLKRTKKRALYLKELTEANACDEKDLANRLQEELRSFLRTCSDAKLVAFEGTNIIILLSNRTTVVCNADNTRVDVFVNDIRKGYFFQDWGHWSRFRVVADDAGVVDENKVRHIMEVLLPKWQGAVLTRDYEYFECSRTLRWIAKEIPGSTQWPDIISGNFPLK